MPLSRTLLERPWYLLNPNSAGRRSGVNAARQKLFDIISDSHEVQCGGRKEFFFRFVFSEFSMV